MFLNKTEKKRGFLGGRDLGCRELRLSVSTCMCVCVCGYVNMVETTIHRDSTLRWLDNPQPNYFKGNPEYRVKDSYMTFS